MDLRDSGLLFGGHLLPAFPQICNNRFVINPFTILYVYVK